MHKIVIGAIAVACLAVGGVWYAGSENNGRDTAIKMTQNGASDADILKAMSSNRRPLTADDIILMKKANVSNAVIIEMLDNRAKKQDVSSN